MVPKRWRIWLWLAWVAAGLSLLPVDSLLEGRLAVLGQQPVARMLAGHWQELGAAAGIVCFLLAGLLFARRDEGRTFVTFAAAIASAGVGVQALKYLVGRARPNAVGNQSIFYGPFGLLNRGPVVPIDAMPSGHTTAAFAMAVALSWRWPRLRILWYVLAAGVGASRTLVDRHFPSDVVLGAAYGCVIGWSICTISDRRHARKIVAAGPQED